MKFLFDPKIFHFEANVKPVGMYVFDDTLPAVYGTISMCFGNDEKYTLEVGNVGFGGHLYGFKYLNYLCKEGKKYVSLRDAVGIVKKYGITESDFLNEFNKFFLNEISSDECIKDMNASLFTRLYNYQVIKEMTSQD